MEATEIIQAIIGGEVDDHLTATNGAIRQRDRYVEESRALENQATLTPGTRVEITGRISPKSLLGTRGVVMDKPSRRRGDIMVHCDHPVYLRRQAMQELAIPASCLKAAA